MKVLGKPRNSWGWVRVAGLVALAGVLAWTMLAAVLREMGEVPWMAWSGYPAFSLLDGFELAVVPLLAAFAAGWLEEQDHRTQAEQAGQQAQERAVAARRKETLRRFHEAVQGANGAPAAPGALAEIVRSALAELEGKGKGEALHFLFEQGLLSGARPTLDCSGMDFGGAGLPKAQLRGVGLERADLSGARLDGAHLGNARVSGATLSKSFLRHADLREAALAACDLSGAHLEHAHLEGADLSGACLEGAFLIQANLKHCTLQDVRVKGAHFRHADLRGSQGVNLAALDEAILIETTLPDGRKMTNELGKEYLRKQEIATLVDRL